jgi:prophage DNA circulation protein
LAQTTEIQKVLAILDLVLKIQVILIGATMIVNHTEEGLVAVIATEVQEEVTVEAAIEDLEEVIAVAAEVEEDSAEEAEEEVEIALQV